MPPTPNHLPSRTLVRTPTSEERHKPQNRTWVSSFGKTSLAPGRWRKKAYQEAHHTTRPASSLSDYKSHPQGPRRPLLGAVVPDRTSPRFILAQVLSKCWLSKVFLGRESFCHLSGNSQPFYGGHGAWKTGLLLLFLSVGGSCKVQPPAPVNAINRANCPYASARQAT